MRLSASCWSCNFVELMNDNDDDKEEEGLEVEEAVAVVDCVGCAVTVTVTTDVNASRLSTATCMPQTASIRQECRANKENSFILFFACLLTCTRLYTICVIYVYIY